MSRELSPLNGGSQVGELVELKIIMELFGDDHELHVTIKIIRSTMGLVINIIVNIY